MRWPEWANLNNNVRRTVRSIDSPEGANLNNNLRRSVRSIDHPEWANLNNNVRRSVRSIDSPLCMGLKCPVGQVCVDGKGFSEGKHCVPCSAYQKRMAELHNNGGQQVANAGQTYPCNGAAGAANTQANTNGQQGGTVGQTNINTAGVTGGTNSGTQQGTATNSNPDSGTSGSSNQGSATNTNPAVSIGSANGGSQQGSASNANVGGTTGSANGGGQQSSATNTNAAVSATGVANGGQQSAATSQVNANACVNAPASTNVHFPDSNCHSCTCMDITKACPPCYKCVDLEDEASVGAHCVLDGMVFHDATKNSGGDSQPNTNNQQGSSTDQTAGNTPAVQPSTNNAPAVQPSTINAPAVQPSTNNAPAVQPSTNNAPVAVSETGSSSRGEFLGISVYL